MHAAYKLKMMSAGAMEVLQSKISLQLDLIARNEEEMELAKDETVKAAANLGRQLHRIQNKLEVSSHVMLLQEKSYQLAVLRKAEASTKSFTPSQSLLSRQPGYFAAMLEPKLSCRRLHRQREDCPVMGKNSVKRIFSKWMM